MIFNIQASLANFDFSLAVIIFCVYVVVDALYARYTLSVTQLRPFSAATTGLVIHFMLAFGVINYINNYLYIIPLALGSWVGTFIVIYKEKNKK